jgi:hypothetical protein
LALHCCQDYSRHPVFALGCIEIGAPVQQKFYRPGVASERRPDQRRSSELLIPAFDLGAVVKEQADHFPVPALGGFDQRGGSGSSFTLA